MILAGDNSGEKEACIKSEADMTFNRDAYSITGLGHGM
jgi:hypothetical protein